MALPPARALPHGSGTARSKAVAPSGAETLQLEPVTLPAVSRLQSLGGLSTSIPEVDLGGLSLSYSSIGNTGGVRLRPCSPFVTLVSGLIILLSFPAGMYSCPCYYYPNRAGSSDRASFVIGIDLRSGTMTSDHWIKRGTALLMSLDN